MTFEEWLQQPGRYIPNKGVLTMLQDAWEQATNAERERNEARIEELINDCLSLRENVKDLKLVIEQINYSVNYMAKDDDSDNS